MKAIIIISNSTLLKFSLLQVFYNSAILLRKVLSGIRNNELDIAM